MSGIIKTSVAYIEVLDAGDENCGFRVEDKGICMLRWVAEEEVRVYRPLAFFYRYTDLREYGECKFNSCCGVIIELYAYPVMKVVTP